MEGKQKAEMFFSELLGKRARNVKLGHGSFITMDFGQDIFLEREVRGEKRPYTRGEWHLWIIMSAWRLDHNDQPLIGAADEREEIEKQLSELENTTLQQVVILNPVFDMIMKFENEIQLTLFSHGVKENKQWMLFTPTRHIFRAGPGSGWNYEAQKK